ncbi:MAG: DUF5675 family protein [Ferruginibacter sp.]
MELQLTRSYYSTGTNGMLFYHSNFICFTIELPWVDNAPQHSCIPEGRYQLFMRYSLRHRTHFLLDGVSNRTLILIHPANDAMKELRGCIAPVMSLAGPGKGSHSRQALQKLKELILGQIESIPVFITIKSN